jgi:glycerol-3-phosphate acyltransferase PlsX
MMAQQFNLAVDAMGGELGPSVIVPAVIQYLDTYPDTNLVLFGLEDQLRQNLPNNDIGGIDRCHVEFCSQSISDDDSSFSALRNKQDSSMWRAVKAVADGGARACVSGGSTGALVAIGYRLLGTRDGIDRPGICTALPTDKGHCYLLDVGASVDSSAQHLHQLARQAKEFVGKLEGLTTPDIALLNIGREPGKGNKVVKQAATLLSKDLSINYVGFIEADELLNHRADIVVCDGFVGNIALKATEGAAKRIINRLAGLGGKAIIPTLAALQAEFNPSNYNGAILLGLGGTIIKSHGNSDQTAFFRALERAVVIGGTGL